MECPRLTRPIYSQKSYFPLSKITFSTWIKTSRHIWITCLWHVFTNSESTNPWLLYTKMPCFILKEVPRVFFRVIPKCIWLCPKFEISQFMIPTIYIFRDSVSGTNFLNFLPFHAFEKKSDFFGIVLATFFYSF